MQEQPQKSWFGKNWMWVLPLGGCLTLALLLILGVGAAFFGIKKVINDSTPYNYAVSLAQNNKDVINALGTPIKPAPLFNGVISVTDSESKAAVSVTLSGPKNKALLYLDAEKINDQWIFKELYVVPEKTTDTIFLSGDELNDF